MNEPATASWGLRISNTDLEKFKAGFRLKDMDDKWYFYATEQPIRTRGSVRRSTMPTLVEASATIITVHIVRSLLNIDVFILHIIEKPGDNGSSGSNAEIASITWEKDRVGQSEEVAKKQVVMISRSVLECDLDALPMYESSE